MDEEKFNQLLGVLPVPVIVRLFSPVGDRFSDTNRDCTGSASFDRGSLCHGVDPVVCLFRPEDAEHQ